MILELAESPRRKTGKYITVDAYKRKSTVSAHKRRRPTLNSGDNHTYIPAHLSEYLVPGLSSGGQGMYVRDDYFDGLSDGDWNTLMEELLEYDPMLSELAARGKWKAKRQAKKATKAAKKKEKWERRQKRRDLRTASKAQKRLMRGQKGANGAEPTEGGESSGGGSILDNIINKGTEIVDKIKTGGGGIFNPGGGDLEPDGQEGDDDRESAPSQSADTIFGMPKMVVYIGGAAAAAGILYMLTKKK